MWLSEWYENPTLPRMPRNDEEEREDLRRQDALAVQGSRLRQVADARLRPAGSRSGIVPGLAAVQGKPGGTPPAGTYPAPGQRADVEPVASGPAGRRGARRGAPRRHPPAPQGGRSHRHRIRPCGRLVRRQKRELRRLGPSHGQDGPAPGRRGRRRGRRAQGAAHALARHEGAALRVPRMHEHHPADRHEAKAGSRQAASRDRRGTQPGHGS